jgi:hypothetical protein
MRRQGIAAHDLLQAEDQGDAQLLGLRNQDDLYIPTARLEFTSKMPFFSFPKIWNNLPLEIKCICNKNEFCNAVKKLFTTNYNPNYTCARLLCPTCHLNL